MKLHVEDTTVKEEVDSVMEATEKMKEEVTDIASEAKEELKEAENAVDDISDKVSEEVSDVKDTVGAAVDEMKDETAEGITEEVKEAVDTPLKDIANLSVLEEGEEIKEDETVWDKVPDEVSTKVTKYNKIEKENDKNKGFRFWLILLGVVIVILSIRLIVVPVAVVGESMHPTYESGNLIVTVNASLKDEIQYDDVIVFRNEGTKGDMYIKRVEGIPGDVIQIKGGRLYRNGELIQDDYDRMEEAGIYTEEMTLKQGEYFVLGDNRNHSTDSRFIGPVDVTDIMYVGIH